MMAAARWIRRDNPRAARAFRDTVLRAAVRLGLHPEIGVRRPDLAPDAYRVFILTGFPYVLVYNAERRPPIIARVLHGARDLQNALRDLQWP
jgi:toxin ParE1/3/4